MKNGPEPKFHWKERGKKASRKIWGDGGSADQFFERHGQDVLSFLASEETNYKKWEKEQ